MSVGVASSEGLTKTEELTSKMAYSHGGQIGLLAGRLTFSPTGLCEHLHNMVACFPQESKSRSQSKCCKVLFD